MKNYEYIVASLPVLSTDWKYGSSESFDTILGDIREQLSKGDNAVMDFLLKGLKVTLSTDDMGIERTNIIKEFNYLEQNFNLTYEQKKTILMNSIDAAFTTDEVKAKLRDVLGF